MATTSRERILKLFPNLRDDKWDLHSDETEDYNCIAFAADVCDTPWWPDKYRAGSWPVAKTDDSVTAFLDGFGAIGYAGCADGSLEDGQQKVALYANVHGTGKHMAIQLADGRWASKLGTLSDIWHATLESLEGSDYGRVHSFLKRPRHVN